MSRRLRILVLFQHYASPDCAITNRHHAFFRVWGQRHDITLVTSDTWQQKRLTDAFEWTPEGVTLHTVPITYENRMGVRERLGAYSAFAWNAFVKGLRLPRHDVVVGVSTPLSAATAGYAVARLKRVPFVLEAKDLWPDFPVQMGAVPSALARRGLYALERHLYHHADGIATVSPDMHAHIAARVAVPGKVVLVSNGTDFDLIARSEAQHSVAELRARYGLSGQRVLLYAGSFGRANNIPLLLTIADRLRDRPDLALVLAGDGFHRPDLEARAREQENVLVLDPQPRHQVFDLFRLADLSLSPFLDLPVLSTNAPSKLYDSLACGTPLVVTNPGWTKRLVEEYRCGWYFPASDPEEAATRTVALLDDPQSLREAGARGHALAHANLHNLFDRRRIAETYLELIERVAGGS